MWLRAEAPEEEGSPALHRPLEVKGVAPAPDRPLEEFVQEERHGAFPFRATFLPACDVVSCAGVGRHKSSSDCSPTGRREQ